MSVCKVILFSVGLAVAPPVIVSAEDVARSIEAAREEVLLRAPALASDTVQQALREAAVQRGILVFVLVDASSAWANASYAPSLAITGDVSVGLVANSTESAALIIDRHTVVAGPLVARAAGPFDAPTRSLSDPALALRRVRQFILAWRESTPLRVTDADVRRLLEMP